MDLDSDPTLTIDAVDARQRVTVRIVELGERESFGSGTERMQAVKPALSVGHGGQIARGNPPQGRVRTVQPAEPLTPLRQGGEMVGAEASSLLLS